MPRDPHLLDRRLGLAFDQDLLAHDRGLLPRALELVARRVAGIEALDKQILHIILAVGQAPGHTLVVADHHAGDAGDAGTGDMNIAAAEMIFVP